MIDLKFAIISNRREKLENIIHQLDKIEDLSFEIAVVYQGYDKIDLSGMRNPIYIEYLDPKESKQGNEVRFAHLRNESIKLGTKTKYIMLMDDDGKVNYKYTPIIGKAIEVCNAHDVLKGFYIAAGVGLVHPMKFRIPYMIPCSTRGLMLPYELVEEALNIIKDIPGINEDIFVALYALSKGIWFYTAPGPISARGQIYDPTKMASSLKLFIENYFNVQLPDILSVQSTPKRDAYYKESGNTGTLKDLFNKMLEIFNKQVEEQYKDIMLKNKCKHEIDLPPYNGIKHK